MKARQIKHSDCRVLAAQVIADVINSKASLATLLPMALEQVQDKDRSLLQELCYGTLRHFFSLRQRVDKNITKPLKEKDSDVRALLLLGAYQLLYTRIPPYAAINSSVNAANFLKKTWAKGLINAVLRNIQRELSQSDDQKQQHGSSATTEEAIHDHPQWLIDQLTKDYGDVAVGIFAANNTKAPMTLRVNRLQHTRADYLCLLGDAQIPNEPTALSDDGIRLDMAVDIAKLPLFSSGAVSIQDEAAQLSAPLLQLSKNLSVLDACAAPGGKTGHLLEIEPSLAVTAIDIDEKRCELIHGNLQRLQLSAQVIVADASHPETWWKQSCGGKLFDRILVDAPCSATGVIRHHPDIKLLRKPGDIPVLAKTQLQLLSALWPLLKSQGYLLYATCSILDQENDAVITQFLSNTPNAKVDVIDKIWGVKTLHGRQLLPQKNGHDGFYFCRLHKQG